MAPALVVVRRCSGVGLKWVAASAPAMMSRSFHSNHNAEEGAEEFGGSTEEELGGWKWAVRKRVWDSLEAEHIFKVPTHRYPKFVGAYIAAEELRKLSEFQSASCVSVQSDIPQKQVRVMTLRDHKKLLVPCITRGAFSMLDPSAMSAAELENACKNQDQATLGKAVGLDAKLKVDLVVVGSVAVDPNTGGRLGKGEGTADLEFALLRYMGAVDDSTLVATTVHDLQLVDDLPADKMLPYDVPVDIICTPTQVIRTNTEIWKPTGIYWRRLAPQRLCHYDILRELRRRIEQKMQKAVKLAPLRKNLPRFPKGQRRGGGGGAAICITGLNPSVTEAELNEHLRRVGVNDVYDLAIYRTSRRGRLICGRVIVSEGADVEEEVLRIDKSELKGWCLSAEVDKEDCPTERAG